MKSEPVVGKRMVVGLTFQDPDEKLIGNVQYHARILRIDQAEGLVVERMDGGGVFNLPPTFEHIKKATQREYRLNAPGEIVREPDYLLVLTVTVPHAAAHEMRSGKQPIAPEFMQSWTKDSPSSLRQ